MHELSPILVQVCIASAKMAICGILAFALFLHANTRN